MYFIILHFIHELSIVFNMQGPNQIYYADATITNILLECYQCITYHAAFIFGNDWLYCNQYVKDVHWPYFFPLVDAMAVRRNGLLTRYEKLWVVHAPGMWGTFTPPPRVCDPDMHHGSCVTHVPWCMPGSLTSSFLWSRWRGNVPGMRNPQFCVSGKGLIGQDICSYAMDLLYLEHFISVR